MTCDRSIEIEDVLAQQDIADSKVENKKEQVIRDIRRGLSNLLESVRGDRDEWFGEVAAIMDGYGASVDYAYLDDEDEDEEEYEEEEYEEEEG